MGLVDQELGVVGLVEQKLGAVCLVDQELGARQELGWIVKGKAGGRLKGVMGKSKGGEGVSLKKERGSVKGGG